MYTDYSYSYMYSKRYKTIPLFYFFDILPSYIYPCFNSNNGDFGLHSPINYLSISAMNLFVPFRTIYFALRTNCTDVQYLATIACTIHLN